MPPTNIVILRHGRIFTFELYVSNKILTPPEILKRLQDIVEQSNQSSGVGIGALTALPRDEWAEVKLNIDIFVKKLFH